MFGQYVSVEEVLGPGAADDPSRDDELGELEDPQFLTHAARTRGLPEAEAEQPINDCSVLPQADRLEGSGVEEDKLERPSSAAGAGRAAGSRPPSQPGELVPHSQSSSSAPKSAHVQTPEDPTQNTLVLPPAVGPGSRDVSRKNSHADASTSYPAPQSPLTGPLPPIHQRVSPHAAHSGPTSAGRRGSPGRSSGSWPGSPTSASPSRREPDKRGGGNNPQQSSYYSSRTRPANKPQPRARHDTTAVDPLFLQTAAYRVVPNVGRVYDWKTQHDINAELSKQRKQEVGRMLYRVNVCRLGGKGSTCGVAVIALGRAVQG